MAYQPFEGSLKPEKYIPLDGKNFENLISY